MKQKKEFLKSTKPHWRSSVSSNMLTWQFLTALVPIWAFNIFQNSLSTLILLFSSVLLGALFQFLFATLLKQGNWFDENAVYQSILFASLVPFGISITTLAFGIFFVVIAAKECFGGSGQNIFNMPLVGFMTVSLLFSSELQTCYSDFGSVLINVSSPAWVSILEIFLIIVGGVFLILRRIIAWQTPVFYFLPVCLAILAFQNSTVSKLPFAPIVFGAFFLVTDYASSPISMHGRIIFSACCGIFLVIFSEWLPGFSAIACAILWMNSISPLIDHYLTRAKSLQ